MQQDEYSSNLVGTDTRQSSVTTIKGKHYDLLKNNKGIIYLQTLDRQNLCKRNLLKLLIEKHNMLFLCRGAEVNSVNDDTKHYVSPESIRILYLDRLNNLPTYTHKLIFNRQRDLESYIASNPSKTTEGYNIVSLYPDSSGNYDLLYIVKGWNKNIDYVKNRRNTVHTGVIDL